MTQWNGVPQPGTFGTAPTSSWQPPSDVEADLWQAKLRGDWAAYLDVLAGIHLYLPMHRNVVEADPGRLVRTPQRYPQVGAPCIAYYTEGMLPVPLQDPVFVSDSLGWMAKSWGNDRYWLAINPGTPCEMFFPGTAFARGDWSRHAERVDGGHRRGVLHTLRVGGPLHGPVAHGLACGAHLSVRNSHSWNSMAYHGCGYVEEKERLECSWGVKDRATWLRYTGELVRGEMVSADWESVLEIRRSLAGEDGAEVEPALWAEAVERTTRSRAESAGRPLSEARVQQLRRLVRRIVRYEARFRADGILPEHGYVRSVLAWSYGRGAGMARWGLAARYGELAEAEDAVIRAGRGAAAAYRSWQDFSAGYILGRCLQFDNEQFAHWYTNHCHDHHVLMSHPESPWRTVAWG